MQHAHAVLDVACDVFQDHDRVIHHEAGGNGQGHQRKIVETIAQQVHAAEGSDQRKRHGNAGNNGRPHGTQEREHHQDHENDRDDQRGLDVLDRCTHGHGAVHCNRQVDRRRNRGLQEWHQRPYPVDRFDDVGSGLTEHDDEHTRLPIGQADVAPVGNRIRHLGHVPQANRRSVVVGHDQRPVLVRGEELIRIGEGVRCGAVGHLPLRPVRVGRIQSVADVIEADSQFVQKGWVHFGAHRRLRRSTHEDLANALHLRELLCQNRICGVVHLGHRHGIRRQRQNQDGRVRRVCLAVARIARQVCRELAARRIDGRLDVARRGIYIPVEIKLKRDAGRAQLTRRCHLVHARDTPELSFQRGGHSRGHGLRVRARQACAHTDHRKIYPRQGSHGQEN